MKRGSHHTAEVRKRISETKRGAVFSADHRAKLSAAARARRAREVAGESPRIYRGKVVQIDA